MANTINRDALLAHCIRMAAQDKAYAWHAAKEYAALYEGWADIPKLLTNHMNIGKAPMADGEKIARIDA